MPAWLFPRKRPEFGTGSKYRFHFSEEWTLVEWHVDHASQSYSLFINGEEVPEVALKKGDYLVQERVKTAKEFFPMLTDDAGTWEFVEQLVDLDPLLFLGKVGSAFTRLSSNELANVTAGGGMVPTFIISEK